MRFVILFTPANGERGGGWLAHLKRTGKIALYGAPY